MLAGENACSANAQCCARRICRHPGGAFLPDPSAESGIWHDSVRSGQACGVAPFMCRTKTGREEATAVLLGCLLCTVDIVGCPSGALVRWVTAGFAMDAGLRGKNPNGLESHEGRKSLQTVKGVVGGEGVCGVLVGEVGGLENTAATVSCFPGFSRAGCLLLS